MTVADGRMGNRVQSRPAPHDPQAVTRGPDLTPEQTRELRARQKARTG